MLKPFQQFIRDNDLFDPNKTVLLAVSGGVDSVVMCELFYRSGFKFAIAHCNFQLRGNESEMDESFVELLAEKYNVPFHSTAFDTKKMAQKKGVSIQEAARELRYNWFTDISKQYNYTKTATAHHQDDSIETFFINLLRGSGIKGLTGIPVINKLVIRPMMCFNRTEILQFSKANKLKYREDSSNANEKYLRNKIRLNLLPLLKNINPSASENIFQTIENLKATEKIYKHAIDKKNGKIKKEVGEDRFKLSIKAIKELDAPELYLFELLYPFGFNHKQVIETLKSMDRISGKNFYSGSYHLLKDRNHFILQKRTNDLQSKYKIRKKDDSIDFGSHNLACKIVGVDPQLKLSSLKSIAQIDMEKLVFPLTIRKWEKGDVFQPIGMKGKKKVSDFLIDNKVSLIDKEDVWVLVSKGIIVWVIGLRIDDRFKITENTRKIYFAELTK